jgi:hypothetical protein
MFDYQFVGMVAVVLAILTRGAVLPVVVVTAFVALVLLACDLGAKWLRGRRPGPAAGETAPQWGVPDADLGQWMAALERVLSSKN